MPSAGVKLRSENPKIEGVNAVIRYHYLLRRVSIKKSTNKIFLGRRMKLTPSDS